MKFILASSNEGKIKEYKNYLKDDVLSFSEVMKPFEIEENGNSFKENALIKAKAVYNALSTKEQKDMIVISDDSGISVPALGNCPGIYSARYAGLPSNAKNNVQKLIQEIKKLNLQKTPAFYTCAIGIIYQGNCYCTHGFMHGHAITTPLGENHFGYDPIFIPKNQTRTLAQMSIDEKQQISHRIKALQLANIILKNL